MQNQISIAKKMSFAYFFHYSCFFLFDFWANKCNSQFNSSAFQTWLWTTNVYGSTRLLFDPFLFPCQMLKSKKYVCFVLNIPRKGEGVRFITYFFICLVHLCICATMLLPRYVNLRTVPTYSQKLKLFILYLPIRMCISTFNKLVPTR